MVLEKSIEQKLRTETKKMGGWAVKFSSPGLDGMLGIVPRWKVGICGTESTGKKDETTSGKEKADIGRTGVFGILRR